MQHLITQATAWVTPGLSCFYNARRLNLSLLYMEYLFTSAKLYQKFNDEHKATLVPLEMAKSTS